MLLSSWNSWTNIWLRETIYIRVARADRKPGFKSTMTTFFVSALWHGVNVCYFMTFILGSLIQSLAKQMRRHVRPFFLPSAEAAANGAREQGPTAPTQSQDQQSKEAVLKFIYDVAGTVLTQCMLNYIVLPFVVLDVKQSLVAVRSPVFFAVLNIFLCVDHAFLLSQSGAGWGGTGTSSPSCRCWRSTLEARPRSTTWPNLEPCRHLHRRHLETSGGILLWWATGTMWRKCWIPRPGRLRRPRRRRSRRSYDKCDHGSSIILAS